MQRAELEESQMDSEGDEDEDEDARAPQSSQADGGRGGRDVSGTPST